MAKIKYIQVILFVNIFIQGLTAQNPTVINPCLIKAYLTISPSYMFSSQQSYFYLHGNLEGFIEKNLSLAGEGYVSLGNISSNVNLFEYNHNLLFGVNKHFIQHNNDFFVGIHPGISFTKLNAIENGLINTNTGINPIFSGIIGYNLFVNNFFHFFLNSRIVVGKHNFDVIKNITELRFSAGLGFNIATKNDKTKNKS